MRQTIIKVDVTDGSTWFPLAEKPDMVWRWGISRRPPEDAEPRHGVNAQIEDERHDWLWRDGRFKYMGVGHLTDHVWLVLQYDLDAPEATVDCTECQQELPATARFCMRCGTPTNRGE